jgi:hypothetical protein
LVLGCRDLGIVVETEDLRGWVQGESLDEVYELMKLLNWGDKVDSTSAILVILFEDIRSHVLGHNCLDESYVFIVCDSASIIDFGSKIVEHLIRDSFILIK